MNTKKYTVGQKIVLLGPDEMFGLTGIITSSLPHDNSFYYHIELDHVFIGKMENFKTVGRDETEIAPFDPEKMLILFSEKTIQLVKERDILKQEFLKKYDKLSNQIDTIRNQTNSFLYDIVNTKL